MSNGDNPARMPVPMGVIAETGGTHPSLTDEDYRRIAGEASRAAPAPSRTRGLALESTIDNADDLSQTGWCVVFASDADPGIKDALKPLLDLRRRQVNDDRLFKIFEGRDGVQPSQSVWNWAASKGVSLGAQVSPRRGVPYYLLLVGSPSRIPFEFQASLDAQWAVGRLWFDDVADYASYARHLVEYEEGTTVPRKKKAAIWIPRNPLDLATPLLAGSIVPEFLGQTVEGDLPVGKDNGFDIMTFVGDGQATKGQLLNLLRGNANGDAPSLIFTGSHGAEWSIQDPAVQRERQGALVTQEWSRGQPLDPSQYLAAADLTADADLRGTMLFLFACFGGGCPATDSYYLTAQGEQIPLTPEPIVARLPQAMLSRGALAIVAHIDRAFSYAFEDVMGTPQGQALRSPLELLARGKRAGLAADVLNAQWNALSGLITVEIGRRATDSPTLGPFIANLCIARDDARNYIVLGDPAARLRTEVM